MDEATLEPTHEWSFSYGWMIGHGEFHRSHVAGDDPHELFRPSDNRVRLANSPESPVPSSFPRSEIWHHWQIVTGERLPPAAIPVLNVYLPETDNFAAGRSWRQLASYRFADPVWAGRCAGFVSTLAFYRRETFQEFWGRFSNPPRSPIAPYVFYDTALLIQRIRQLAILIEAARKE